MLEKPNKKGVRFSATSNKFCFDKVENCGIVQIQWYCHMLNLSFLLTPNNKLSRRRQPVGWSAWLGGLKLRLSLADNEGLC